MGYEMKKTILSIFLCFILFITLFQSDWVSSHINTDDISNEVNQKIEQYIEQNSTKKFDTFIEKTADKKNNSDLSIVSGECQIHFLNVGQADATLIICNDKAMLIDAGSNDQGTYVQNYLQKLNITDLEYVIGTHPDEDHYGGLDVIITKFNCKKVLLSPFYKDTATVRDVYSALKYKNIEPTEIIVGNTYSLGDASFEILGPAQEYDNANDSSICIKLSHGSNTFLFMGDATEVAEADILASGIDLHADVYKVSHHGSYTSSSEALLQAVKPTYAVISCGENNSYGHPHAGPLNRMRQMGIQLYRTDEQGTVIVTSDGNSLTWNCSPSDTWQAG